MNSKQFLNKFQQKHSKYVYLLKSMYNIQLLYTYTYNRKNMHLFFYSSGKQHAITLLAKQNNSLS